jgi:hypothetical protein
MGKAAPKREAGSLRSRRNYAADGAGWKPRARDEKSPSLIISYDEDSERGKVLTAELLSVHAVWCADRRNQGRASQSRPFLLGNDRAEFQRNRRLLIYVDPERNFKTQDHLLSFVAWRARYRIGRAT